MTQGQGRGRPTAVSLEDSVGVLRNLVTQSEALVTSLDRDRKLWRTVIGVILAGIVVVALMISGLGYQVWQYEEDRKDRSAQNAEILRQNAETSEQIADCTTEGGKCYAEGQKRVAGVIRGYIVVAQCQRSTTTDEELERCVARRLAAATPGGDG